MPEEWILNQEQVDKLMSLVEDVPVGGARFNCTCGYTFSSDVEIDVFRDRRRHWDIDCPLTKGYNAA